MGEEQQTDKNESNKSEDSRTLQAWLAGIGVGCLVVAAMIAAYEIGTNNPSDPGAGKNSVQVAEEPPAKTVAASPGQDLFAADCGTCHTLSEADTTGAVGPNLDDLQPDAALVTAAIENGGAGSGAMPANIVSGEDAQLIADFVAESVSSSK